jgi:hypothetical protein
MPDVAVLTVTEAASRLDERRETIPVLVARGELTPATINGRPAVVDDAKFRRAQRRAATAAQGAA